MKEIFKKGIKRRLLSFGLVMAMVISLLPMNSKTVFAAAKQTITLTASDITETVYNGIPKTFKGVTVTVMSGQFEANGNVIDMYVANPTGPIKFSMEDGSIIYKIQINASNTNGLWTSGVWESADGATSVSADKYVTDITSIIITYASPHTHTWDYSKSGEVITATCTAEGCSEPVATATLSLTANNAANTGTTYVGATAEWSIEDTNLATPELKYKGRGNTTYNESTTAPTAMGTYTVTATVGSESMSADFIIHPSADDVKQALSDVIYADRENGALMFEKSDENAFSAHIVGSGHNAFWDHVTIGVDPADKNRLVFIEGEEQEITYSFLWDYSTNTVTEIKYLTDLSALGMGTYDLICTPVKDNEYLPSLDGMNFADKYENSMPFPGQEGAVLIISFEKAETNGKFILNMKAKMGEQEQSIGSNELNFNKIIRFSDTEIALFDTEKNEFVIATIGNDGKVINISTTMVLCPGHECDLATGKCVNCGEEMLTAEELGIYNKVNNMADQLIEVTQDKSLNEGFSDSDTEETLSFEEFFKTLVDGQNKTFTKDTNTYTWEFRQGGGDPMYYVVTLDGDSVASFVMAVKISSTLMPMFTFKPHEHGNWTYEVKNGNQIEATCGKNYCDLTSKPIITLTTEDKDYSGSAYDGLSIKDSTGKDISNAENAWKKAEAGDLTVEYVGKAPTVYAESTTAPTKIGTYTVKVYPTSEASNPIHVATVDFAITRKTQSDPVAAKVIDFDSSNWEYNFYTNGTYTSNVTGDTSGTLTILKFYNTSGTAVSFSGAPFENVSDGNYSSSLDTSLISDLLSAIPDGNGVGVTCAYNATTHTVSITPIIHSHDWRYSATGNKLEAYCANAYCPSGTSATNKLSLTIIANNAIHSGSPVSAFISEDEKDAWNNAKVDEPVPTIKYFGRAGTENPDHNNAPTEIGKYTAKITIGTVTATKDFDIVHRPAGDVKHDTTKEKDNYAGAALKNTGDELRNLVLTSQEKSMVDEGAVATIWLDVKVKELKNISAIDAEKMRKAAPIGYIIPKNGFMDINLYKLITLLGEEYVNEKVTKVPNGNKVKITVTVPTELQRSGRVYKIIRIHDGVAEALDTIQDANYNLTFETDRFSVYAISYFDNVVPWAVKSPKTEDNSKDNHSAWMYLMLAGLGVFMISRRRKDA